MILRIEFPRALRTMISAYALLYIGKLTIGTIAGRAHLRHHIRWLRRKVSIVESSSIGDKLTTPMSRTISLAGLPSRYPCMKLHPRSIGACIPSVCVLARPPTRFRASRSRTVLPAVARDRAAIAPAHPAPMTMQSYIVLMQGAHQAEPKRSWQ
jgi:hypothetical protein